MSCLDKAAVRDNWGNWVEACTPANTPVLGCRSQSCLLSSGLWPVSPSTKSTRWIKACNFLLLFNIKSHPVQCSQAKIDCLQSEPWRKIGCKLKMTPATCSSACMTINSHLWAICLLSRLSASCSMAKRKKKPIVIWHGFIAPWNNRPGSIVWSKQTVPAHQFVFLQSMFLLVAQWAFIQVDDILAVLRTMILRRPVVWCLLRENKGKQLNNGKPQPFVFLIMKKRNKINMKWLFSFGETVAAGKAAENKRITGPFWLARPHQSWAEHLHRRSTAATTTTVFGSKPGVDEKINSLGLDSGGSDSGTGAKEWEKIETGNDGGVLNRDRIIPFLFCIRRLLAEGCCRLGGDEIDQSREPARFPPKMKSRP